MCCSEAQSEKRGGRGGEKQQLLPTETSRKSKALATELPKFISKTKISAGKIKNLTL